MKLGDLVGYLRLDSRGWLRGVSMALGGLGRLGSGIARMAIAPFKSLTAQIIALTTALVGFNQVWQATLEGFRQASLVQNAKIAFEQLAGGERNAEILLERLKQLAIQTPLTFEEIAKAGKMLIGFGTPVEDLIKDMRMLGNIDVVTRSGLNDLAYLLGTARVEGRLLTRDLRQFGTRGVPIIKDLADAFDVSEGEVYDLAEAGELTFPKLYEALESLAGASGRWGKMLEETAGSLTGIWNRLQGMVQLLLGEVTAAFAEAFDLDDKMTRLLGWMNWLRGALKILVEDQQAVFDLISKAWDAALYEMEKSFRDFAAEIFRDIGDTLIDIGKALANVFFDPVGSGEAVNRAIKNFMFEDENVPNPTDVFEEAFEKFNKRVQDKLEGLEDVAEQTLDPVPALIQDFVEKEDDKEASKRSGKAFAGAVEAGTVDAYSAIVNAQGASKFDQLNASNKQQVELLRKQLQAQREFIRLAEKQMAQGEPDVFDPFGIAN